MIAIETIIPTLDGWKTVGDLQRNDYIFDECGKPQRITAISDQINEKICMSLEFSDGATLKTDVEHRWLTRSYKEFRKFMINKNRGKFLVNWESLFHNVSTIDIKNNLHCRIYFEHAVQIAKALQRPAQALIIPPYVLGIWLGDGASATHSITTTDLEIIEFIKGMGYTVQKGKGHPCLWWLTDGQKSSTPLFKAQLREMGLLQNKHVPEVYFRGSIDQRTDLLMGLMDSDGTVNKTGKCSFVNRNKLLADAVYELICSLGVKAAYGTVESATYGKHHGTAYRVFFSPSIPVFRLPRKLNRQRLEASSKREFRSITNVCEIPSLPVRAVEVDSPSRLYLVGKACIPIHSDSLV